MTLFFFTDCERHSSFTSYSRNEGYGSAQPRKNLDTKSGSRLHTRARIKTEPRCEIHEQATNVEHKATNQNCVHSKKLVIPHLLNGDHAGISLQLWYLITNHGVLWKNLLSKFKNEAIDDLRGKHNSRPVLAAKHTSTTLTLRNVHFRTFPSPPFLEWKTIFEA